MLYRALKKEAFWQLCMSKCTEEDRCRWGDLPAMLTVPEAFTRVRGSIERGQIAGGLNLLHKIRIREVSVQLLPCLLNTEKGWEETIKHSSLQNPVKKLSLNFYDPEQLQYL